MWESYLPVFSAFVRFFQAYKDTLQTQWSWLLLITKCIDVHLKENAAYNQVTEQLTVSTDAAFLPQIPPRPFNIKKSKTPNEK